ncbi:hypothetical protein MRB53_009106 [Persea americana]|uniref:Uncharacterized protein n=1 Tax=Persea americana TaxID=3435 RepID=A0ACC2LN27_PERAE|nr:hypothetical protein MRB53_009106 [Persea americana]
MLIEGAHSMRKVGSIPVYLNVYDITVMNGCAYFLGLGVYHSGVQVYDVEYAFGAHEYPTTGVFEGEPKQCPGFTFRKSIMIGRTGLSPKEVRRLMEELAEEYTGDTYHLITRNCNHFCHDACLRLTGKRIPRWVNRLARIGMLFNCVFPSNVHPERVRHRSDDGFYSVERNKLRSNSTRCCSSSLQPPPSTTTTTCTTAIVRSKRRCSSLSAPPLLTSSLLNL